MSCAIGGTSCLEPAARAGFSVDEAEITIRGLCAQCQPGPARRIRQRRGRSAG